MPSVIDLRSTTPAAYLEPVNFADYLSKQLNYCLFLDIDGTLAEFTLNPKDSVIPTTTLTLLQNIQRCGVPIAVVTGRSLAEAVQMLSPIHLPIAATHGLEISFADTLNHTFDKAIQHTGDRQHGSSDGSPVDMAELTALKQSITQGCESYSDLSIENKPYSCALHFRQNPTLADVAYTMMSDAIKNYSNWTLKQGKFVWEIVPKGVNKGTAILTLLDKLQQGAGYNTDKLCPIFIGDDVTDEAGFMAVQGNDSSNDTNQKIGAGLGIKVGHEPTYAHYYINNIQEVTLLLEGFLAFCQQHATSVSNFEDTKLIHTKNTTKHVI